MKILTSSVLAVILTCVVLTIPVSMSAATKSVPDVQVGGGGPGGAPISAFVLGGEVYYLLNYFAPYNSGPYFSGCSIVQRGSDGEQFVVHFEWIYTQSTYFPDQGQGPVPQYTFILEQLSATVEFITALGQNYYHP
jgi:hypothetical protein